MDGEICVRVRAAGYELVATSTSTIAVVAALRCYNCTTYAWRVRAGVLECPSSAYVTCPAYLRLAGGSLYGVLVYSVQLARAIFLVSARPFSSMQLVSSQIRKSSPVLRVRVAKPPWPCGRTNGRLVLNFRFCQRNGCGGVATCNPLAQNSMPWMGRKSKLETRKLERTMYSYWYGRVANSEQRPLGTSTEYRPVDHRPATT
eukprot:scaffold27771_cov34-Prasinocladus_malaysianus.AAC.1